MNCLQQMKLCPEIVSRCSQVHLVLWGKCGSRNLEGFENSRQNASLPSTHPLAMYWGSCRWGGSNEACEMEEWTGCHSVKSSLPTNITSLHLWILWLCPKTGLCKTLDEILTLSRRFEGSNSVVLMWISDHIWYKCYYFLLSTWWILTELLLRARKCSWCTGFHVVILITWCKFLGFVSPRLNFLAEIRSTSFKSLLILQQDHSVL